MSQWNDKPNDWPWPDPVHRVYMTLLAQRKQHNQRWSRRALRAMARRIAAKRERGVFDWTGTANVLKIEPHKAGALVR